MIRFFKALFNLVPFMYDFWGIAGALLAIICIIIVLAVIWLLLYTIVFTIVTLTGHQLPKKRIVGKSRIGRFFVDGINKITSFIATIPARLKALPGAVRRLPETVKSIPAGIEKKKEEKIKKQEAAEDYSYIKADVIDIEPDIPDLENPEGALKKRPSKNAKDEAKDEAKVIAGAISEAAKALSSEDAKAEERPESVVEVTAKPDTTLITGAIPRQELILEPITKISTADDCTFAYSHEVLNRCFGKDYKSYSRSSMYLNDEHTICVWFPKVYTTVAAAEKASASAKESVFAISKNRQYLHTVGKITDDGEGIRFVFAKIGRKPYKFLGVFTKDVAKSRDDVLYFRQIETESDLSRWNT